MDKEISYMNEKERLLKEKELDEITREERGQHIVFEPGEKISDNSTVLNIINYGKEGFLYAATQTIVKSNDEEKLINIALGYCRKEHNIAILTKMKESAERDEETNKLKIKKWEKMLEDYKELIKFTKPIHTTDDLNEIRKQNRFKSVIKKVALKFIGKEEFLSKPLIKDKFYKEIALISRLEHPNVTRYFSTLEHEKGIGYFEEYLHGRTLDKIISDTIIKEKSDLPPKDVVFALSYFVFDALDHIHKKGIVHEDIKTENIMLTLNEGLVKIVDFGLASEIGDTWEVPSGSEKNMHPYKLKIKKRIGSVNEKYVASAGSDIYSAIITILNFALGLRFPLSADSTDSLDYITPKVKDINKYIKNNKEKYNKDEKSALYKVFDKKTIKPELNSIKLMPSAEEMRNDFYNLLFKRGYRTHSEIQNILKNYVLPVKNAIAESYKREEVTSTSESV